MSDILDTKIKQTANYQGTSFGHNGEVYTNLRPYTTSGGMEGYRFNRGESNDPYLTVYFISDDGAYLSAWERGYGVEYLKFKTPVNEDLEQDLDDRFTMLNQQLDEGVFNARLATAVDAYEATGQPQDFEWRGNSYTNLHDPGKSHVDYRFEHGQGDQLKVFFFEEDGSYVSGWSRTGQTTHRHLDTTETENLHARLVEVDQELPLSHVTPLSLEEHLTNTKNDDPKGYEFQIAGREMVAFSFFDGDHYAVLTDIDSVNYRYYGHAVQFSADGESFFISPGDDHEGVLAIFHWGWSPTNDDELGELLYGNGLSDTLYNRIQFIENEYDGAVELYENHDLTGVLAFNVAVNRDSDNNGIIFDIEGTAENLFGYGSLTDIEAAISRDDAGSELIGLSFSGEFDDLYGYDEEVTLEGNIHKDGIDLYMEIYDLLGYEECIFIDFVIGELPSGYRVSFDISADEYLPFELECSGTADMDDNFTVSSLSFNCSSQSVENEFEDAFDELLDATSEVLMEYKELQAEVNQLVAIEEFHFMDETAPQYIGAFAPVDSDVWMG